MKKRLITLLACLCLLASLGSACASEEIIYFGTCEQDFPGQEIAWIVLSRSGGTTVLMSQQALLCMPFDEDTSEWEDSELCNWLNTTFLYDAFTKAERETLLADSDGNQILIPSKGDVTNESFGFAKRADAKDSLRVATGTSYAIDQGLWTNEFGECSYYTRTKTSGGDLYQVRTSGALGAARSDRENVGVRLLIYVTTGK